MPTNDQKIPLLVILHVDPSNAPRETDEEIHKTGRDGQKTGKAVQKFLEAFPFHGRANVPWPEMRQNPFSRFQEASLLSPCVPTFLFSHTHASLMSHVPLSFHLPLAADRHGGRGDCCNGCSTSRNGCSTSPNGCSTSHNNCTSSSLK